MKIEPGRIINDFIEPNKRQYAIPVYQRNYEWSKEQCVKLFEDIIQAYKKDKTHFCGSVVYALLKEEKNIFYYIIIDGQQRLTTIYLLLKALLDCAENDSEKEILQETLFNKDKFDTYDVDTSSKLKLKPIKSDNNQLSLLMDNKFDEIDRSSGIWHNYDLFCTLIKEKLDSGMYVKEIYKGVEKLLCAKIKLDEDDNAQEIFERINSTGVPLGLSDKIRNYVLMTEVDQDSLYENYWLKSEVLLHRNNMDSFFLDYLNMKIDGFAKLDNAYDDFKKYFVSKKFTNESMLKEILHYAEIYHAFLYGSDKYSDKVNSYLINLQRLKQTTCFLFLFRVFDDYEDGIIDGKELEKILEFVLNYSIRRMICEVGSNSLRGLYKTLYGRVFANPKNKEHYFDALVSFMNQLTSKDALPNDEMFIKALKENNLYRKNALCKFLLTEIENQGKEKLVIDNLTIEHIMPQNKNLSTSWQNMLGDDWVNVREKYLHTLGNLTLTGYNSELGDKPFDEKKKKLEGVTKVVTLYADVKDCNQWNESTIQERANKLSDLIVSLFPKVLPDVEISFSDPRYQEYTCDDPDTAKFKAPNYYVLNGERVSISTFADMLKSIISRLYDIEPTIIEEMAKNNEKLLSPSKYAMFSYDVNKVTHDYKIEGTDIYESTGFSAPTIMYIVRLMIDKYEIDRSDFVYSARVK